MVCSGNTRLVLRRKRGMRADEVKVRMLKTLLFDKSYQCAVTEYSGRGCLGIADVFGFTKAGYSHEVEVKVNSNDLKGELNSVNLLISQEPIEKDGEQDFSYSTCLKLDKHCRYLNAVPPGEIGSMRCLNGYNRVRERDISLDNLPNSFSFAVPSDLREIAEEGLVDSPYGLFVITRREYQDKVWFSYDEVKTPEKLHKDKITEEIKEYMIRKSSVEVFTLRQNNLL